MGKNKTIIKIKNRKKEQIRQYNLENCWLGLNKIKNDLSEFLKLNKYKKNNFNWDIYINNLYGDIKQIILTNNCTLKQSPYIILIQHYNKLTKLNLQNDIINELNNLLYTLTKYCKCV